MYRSVISRILFYFVNSNLLIWASESAESNGSAICRSVLSEKKAPTSLSITGDAANTRFR